MASSTIAGRGFFSRSSTSSRPAPVAYRDWFITRTGGARGTRTIDAYRP
jgi:hypothetical protein